MLKILNRSKAKYASSANAHLAISGWDPYNLTSIPVELIHLDNGKNCLPQTISLLYCNMTKYCSIAHPLKKGGESIMQKEMPSQFMSNSKTKSKQVLLHYEWGLIWAFYAFLCTWQAVLIRYLHSNSFNPPPQKPVYPGAKPILRKAGHSGAMRRSLPTYPYGKSLSPILRGYGK